MPTPATRSPAVPVREDIVTLAERVEALREDPRMWGTAEERTALYLDIEATCRAAGWTWFAYEATIASVYR